ncbi:uncharacterized protein L969DRAFT_93200 [Mixia osmundae IAM 14324]|uniref:DUF1264 domain-containing protein n=1 Tax=Mixia osmundae (strain CBS 9802 / IAM 14324 / JCM 22182 / KY 12970) TaxID=764103 RepID=G7E5T2_MIXOS|nr:uncharacterized protein L969DRAFT_93200 [Mixia osmundae IAM 14324]KEI40656.1 hypothetical protein L969DRAFT_93200 [Mixia osmundae IAM 14324]GAA98192.1 hypothetical protein E5Q_04875 [Mixia osmundae IAM 14324]
MQDRSDTSCSSSQMKLHVTWDAKAVLYLCLCTAASLDLSLTDGSIYPVTRPVHASRLHKMLASVANSLSPAVRMSHPFKPLEAIHQHLCAFHYNSDDRTRQVEAHHYCCASGHGGLHQCLVYDSDGPDARLIGIEYIVSADVYKTLDDEEKKYWHSHKYEVESGMLVVASKKDQEGPINATVEKTVMVALHETFGKTIHTWQIDRHPHLPLGPPVIMMAFTEDGQVDPDKLAARDKALGISTEDKKKERALYLPKTEQPLDADLGERTGETIQLQIVPATLKK